jgi:hypothetical protein
LSWLSSSWQQDVQREVKKKCRDIRDILGTKNFIPVEKKDFTKIIYGEQLSQSPEKNVGDLKALEQVILLFF